MALSKPNLNKPFEAANIERLDAIIDLLKRIERQGRPVIPEAVAIKLGVLKINPDGSTEESDMNLKLSQNARITIKGIVDAAGNPAKVEGDKLDWVVAGDQSLGELQVAEDGMSALFVRNGAVGTCTVQVSGDADLGPDVKTIIGEAELVCLGGEAVAFQLDVQAEDVVV